MYLSHIYRVTPTGNSPAKPDENAPLSKILRAAVPDTVDAHALEAKLAILEDSEDRPTDFTEYAGGWFFRKSCALFALQETPPPPGWQTPSTVFRAAMYGTDPVTYRNTFYVFSASRCTFACVGSVKQFGIDFVDKAAPLYEDKGVMRMRIPAQIVFGDFLHKSATLWNTACQKVFRLDAATLEGLWSQCADASHAQKLVDKLNEAVGSNFVFVGSAKIFNGRVQVNINDVCDV